MSGTHSPASTAAGKEHHDVAHFEAIRKTQTAESVIMPRDVFEKLYLNPHQQPRADALRKTFGNPTPISLIGFLIAATPKACAAMGWRGAGGGGGAILSVFIFFGGLVQLLGAVGEWILGNTFSCALFFTYGTFWIVQGTTLIPSFAAGAAYSLTGNSLEGQATPSFHSTTGFYYVSLAILTVIFVICSLRTNVCLLMALILLVVAFGCFAGVHFELALENAVRAERLEVIGGAFTFALCTFIWYLLLAELLEAVDFPISLPVGDLSTLIPGRSQRMRRRKNIDEV